MVLLKNKPIFIAIITLSIITAITVIALEESISVSDRVETESIPVTSNNEPTTSSSSTDDGWSRVLTLTLSNLPTLGETAEVVLVVNNTSKSPAPASFVTGMSLSGNFEVLNPPSNIQSFDHGGFFIKGPMPHDLYPNEILTMNWTIRAVEEGEAVIFGGGLTGSTAIRLVIGAEETLLKEDFDRLYPPQRQNSPPQGSYPNHFTPDEDPNEVVDNSNVVVLITDDQIREEIERISEKIEQMGYDDDDVIHDILVSLKELLANSTSTEDSDLEKQSFLDSILPKAYASTSSLFTLHGIITNTNSPYDPDRETDVYGLMVCAVDQSRSRRGGVSFTTLHFVNGSDACTRTSESGGYSIKNIVNDDPNDSTGADVYLLYKTDGTYVDIKNEYDYFYTGINYVMKNLPTSSSTTMRADYDISNIRVLHQSAWILDAMSEAREFFYDKGLNITTPVTVKWQYNKVLADISDPNKCADSTCYDRFTNTIWLDGVDDMDSFTLGGESNIRTQLHEYGHHVMKTVYGNNGWVGDCPSPHSIYETSSTSCAWSEGWAGFVPHFVLDEAQLQRNPSIIYDLERDRVFSPEDSTQIVDESWEKQDSDGWVGHKVEGQVASMLWDIHDYNQDRSDFGQDNINPRNNFLDDEIVSAFEKHNGITKNSAEDYYNDWNRLNPSFPLKSIAKLHYMAFANDAPVTPTGSTIFSDDFEGTLSHWTLTGDSEIWEIRQGIQTGTTGSVASSDDCDKKCYMVSDSIDASQAATLTFDRYVATSIDNREGLKVEVSTNNGITWTELIFYSTVPRTDDSTWHSEELDISQYQSSTFNLKFTSISSSRSEIVQLDNVVITGSSSGGVTPPTSLSFEDNFDNLDNWSKSGYDRWSVVSSWGEDLPEGETSFIAANNCDIKCILTSETIDLSSLSSATLEVSRFVDRSLDRGEYLSIEVYDGSWTEIAKWGADNSQDTDVWESESINISRYLDDNFKIKIITLQSRDSEDTGIDYIRITS